jgi:hypothetical protein
LYVLSGDNQSASACASSSKWWVFDGFLEIVMVVSVIIVGFRVYRYNFPKRRRPTQEYWPR